MLEGLFDCILKKYSSIGSKEYPSGPIYWLELQNEIQVLAEESTYEYYI